MPTCYNLVTSDCQQNGQHPALLYFLKDVSEIYILIMNSIAFAVLLDILVYQLSMSCFNAIQNISKQSNLKLYFGVLCFLKKLQLFYWPDKNFLKITSVFSEALLLLVLRCKTIDYSYQAYADMHIALGKANGNTASAIRIYQQKYPYRRVPYESQNM